MATNRFGLSRLIPDDVKEIIRKNSGFGCVICGAIPYEYEHIDPEFKDAKVHDPDCMALLCPTHNHMKFKGLLSVHDVKEHAKRPYTMIQNYASFKFVRPGERFRWKFPKIELVGNSEDICVDGKPVLSITSGGVPNEPIMINGSFFDARGRHICEIKNNELKVFSENVIDFTNIRNRFAFMMEGGEACLNFTYDSEEKTLNFIEMNYFYNGAFIRANSEEFVCGGRMSQCDYTGSTIIGCGVAVNLRSGPVVYIGKRTSLSMRGCTLGYSPVGISAG